MPRYRSVCAICAAVIAAALSAPAQAQHSHGHAAGHAGHGEGHGGHGAGHGEGQGAAAAMSAAERAALEQELAIVARSVARFADPRVAAAEGWERATVGGDDTALMGEHWTNPDVPEYGPGEPLDLTRPNVLQYALVDGERVFVGVAFTMRLAAGEMPPDAFSGPLDRWHLHDGDKIVSVVLAERPFLQGAMESWMADNYTRDGVMRAKLWMLHVWVGVGAPDGPFAHYNYALPWLRVGLPPEMALQFGAYGPDAAEGVDIARAGGCGYALDGLLWIADASWRQKRMLREICAEEAARVRAALARGAPDAVVATAEAAWRRMDAAIAGILDDAQRARIDAMAEH